MNIYNYNRVTGEFLSISEASLDPIDQKPLIPAFSTDIKPPEKGEDEAVVFKDGWLVVPDFRGQSFYSDEEHVTIMELGLKPDALWEKEKPLPLLKIEKISKISSFLDRELFADIDSNALGQNNRYSKEDEGVVIALIAGGKGGRLTVNKKTARGRFQHNDIQMKKLMQDFNLRTELLYDKHDNILTQIENADSLSDLDIITWE